jgi:hypothetical protein
MLRPPPAGLSNGKRTKRPKRGFGCILPGARRGGPRKAEAMADDESKATMMQVAAMWDLMADNAAISLPVQTDLLRRS